jgi:hypothetical protein
VVIPSATMLVQPCSSIPSSIITARRRSASGRFISFHKRSRVPCTNVRDTADFDVQRASCSTASPTGSWTRRYLRVDTPDSIRSSTTPSSWVAPSEMPVGLKRHFCLAVRCPDPRALNPNTPPAERDLPILVAMTHRGPIPVPLALQTDHLIDLGLQQLAQHTQPDLDRQRQQPLSRYPNQLPQRLLHPLREHRLTVDRLSDRYV